MAEEKPIEKIVEKPVKKVEKAKPKKKTPLEISYDEYRESPPSIKKNMSFADFCINSKLDKILNKIGDK